MKISQIMSANPLTVGPETAVGYIAHLLSEHKIGGVPVVAPSGRLLGIVTEDDLIVRNANLHLPTYLGVLDAFINVRGSREFDDEVRHVLGTRADQVMSAHLYTVNADADVADAATIIVEKHASPLPVVKNGQLVGIVSRSDIVRLLARREDGQESEESE